MDVVALFHDRLATTMLLFFLAAGGWGLFEYIRGGTLSGNIAGALLLGQALVMLQGTLGVVLFLSGTRLNDPVHLLYGLTAVLVLPFVWSYMRNRAPRQGLLIYSLISLFIVGLAIRGMTTGGG